MLVWILAFSVSSLFWAWIIFWGGAELLEGSILSAFLDSHAPSWSADGIKLFAGGMWALGFIWFVIGLIYPSARVLSFFG